MGYELDNIREVRIGEMPIDICDDLKITSLECDNEDGHEYVEDQPPVIIRYNNMELRAILRINPIVLFKLIGTWQSAIEFCPNKRVVHLMKNHKDDRVKLKNYWHAMNLIRKMSRRM